MPTFGNKTTVAGERKVNIPGGRVLLGIFGGGVLPGSPNPDPVSDQKSNFPHLFSNQNSKIHTRFQTWPLGRNYFFSCILMNFYFGMYFFFAH